MHTHTHEIISESTNGLISFCPLGDQYELAFKNALIVISNTMEFEQVNLFFQNVKPKKLHPTTFQKKNYIFRIANSTTFFAFDKYEIRELKELLARAQFHFEVQRLLFSN